MEQQSSMGIELFQRLRELLPELKIVIESILPH